MNNIIELNNIRKTFNNGEISTTALENISLGINKGDITGIFGPNGSGKTTLIKIISTLILPDTGNLTVAQYDSRHYARKIRTLIGYAGGDERGFYGRITVRQNLQFFGRLYDLNNGTLNRSIASISESLGLTAYLGTIYQQCSSGIKQRVSLAKSLLHNPEILLIDEFTKSIDPLSADSIRRFLKTLSEERKITILLTSHDLADIENICTHAALLQAGRILRYGDISELTQNGSVPLKNILTDAAENKEGTD